MARINKRDLESLLKMIQKETQDDSYTVEFAYGQPRLYRQYGSREVSPRLTRGQLYDWMRAYYDGVQEGYKVAKREG